MFESSSPIAYCRRGAALAVIVVLTSMALPLSPVAAEEEASIAALRQMGRAFASIAEKASPAVVGVRAVRPIRSISLKQEPSEEESVTPFEDELYRYFFGPRETPRSPQGDSEEGPRQIAQGSGFIISSDGYILTNNHMVGQASSVTVQLADGRRRRAEIIGADPETDVAVIKIDETDLPFIELADSDELVVGEWVVAIGNPFELSHTVTAGIVSAKGRADIGIANYEDLIQTDAAINLGNSGGPLLDLNGCAVGINTAIIGPGGNVGIGLAIPSNMARNIYTQFKETGRVVRGFLGVSLQSINSQNARFFDLEQAKGALISHVFEGSAAEDAGLQQGDVVVEFEGEPVDNDNSFRNRIAMHQPGAEVEIVVVRDGKHRIFTATLGERPEDTETPREVPEVRVNLGMTVQTLTEELARQLDYEGLSGVVVTEVRSGSPADEVGIERGMLIHEVNRQPIRNVREFNDAIDQAREQEDSSMLLLIRSEGVDTFVVLNLTD